MFLYVTVTSGQTITYSITELLHLCSHPYKTQKNEILKSDGYIFDLSENCVFSSRNSRSCMIMHSIRHTYLPYWPSLMSSKQVTNTKGLDLTNSCRINPLCGRIRVQQVIGKYYMWDRFDRSHLPIRKDCYSGRTAQIRIKNETQTKRTPPTHVLEGDARV